MSITLLRISRDHTNNSEYPDLGEGSVDSVIQALLEVVEQLEPLGQTLAHTDGAIASWVLKRHSTDHETILQLETGDDANGRISYWFEGPESERLCQAITTLDTFAFSLGKASYRLSRETTT